jgi:hypothetical protein
VRVGVQVGHGVGREGDVEAELIDLACGDLNAVAGAASALLPRIKRKDRRRLAVVRGEVPPRSKRANRSTIMHEADEPNAASGLRRCNAPYDRCGEQHHESTIS